MEAGEYGLTRRTYYVAGHLEVAAVAGLLCISRCVLGAPGFFEVFSFDFFFFERTRPVASMRPACLIYLSTSTGVRMYRVPLFNEYVCVSVYLCVCVTFVVLLIARAGRGQFPQNPESMEAGERGLTRGTCFVARRLEVVAVARLLWISWCVLDGTGLFRFFFLVFFFFRTHTACCKYEAFLPHLPLY